MKIEEEDGVMEFWFRVRREKRREEGKGKKRN